MFYFKYLVFFVLLIGCVIPTLLTNQKPKSDDQACDKEDCSKDVDTSTTSKPCRQFKLSEFGPNNASIMYGGASGRLGNQLLGYAALIELQLSYGFQSYVDAECRDYISMYFTPDSCQLPVLAEEFCNPDDIPFEAYHGHIKVLLTDLNYRKGKLIHFFPPRKATNPNGKGGYKPEDHISNEQETFSRGYSAHLRKTLKYRPHILARVNKTLKKIAKKLGKKTKDVTYVGIHNRRTDHIEFIKRTNGAKPMTPEYFHDAMDYFREEYDNVAFVFVSDDMDWGRKNVVSDHGDLFFAGQGENLDETGNEAVDPDAVSYDLALLTHCNHTIISRGTYSMWAAVLTGGEYYTEYGVIVPPELMNPSNP